MRFCFVVFPGFQLLDLSGPAAVFAAAGDALGRPVECLPVSAAGGAVRSNCGIAVATVAIDATTIAADDTLLVVGGDGPALRDLMNDAPTGKWFADGTRQARRFGSICTGAFALAAWGLVDGRRVATHWRGASRLAAAFPAVDVDAEAMFIEDGALWTSAGVTAGIDMALARVERDHGAALAGAIAQRLVLSVRRPGWQSQFSPLAAAQVPGEGRYAELIGYVAANLAAPLGVEALAARARESPRSFHRHFTRAAGKTPAAFVTAARLDRVRALLAEGLSIKAAAAACGFASPERLSKTFRTAFGVSPAAWRTMNSTASAPSRR